MTNLEIGEVDLDATCDELRDALARQQSLLTDATRIPGAMLGGAVDGGTALIPGASLDDLDTTAIEAEIQRLHKAMEDKGCD